MKQCTYCGKEYSDEASVCASDRHPLRDVVPALSPASPSPIAGEKQQIIDSEHIKLLSIFHFIVAALALLGIVFLFLHYFAMSSAFSNLDMWKSKNDNMPPLPKDFLKAFIWFYFFMGAIFGTACILNLLSGLFLRQRRHRTFSIIVGGLNCLQIPFGTILGVFTIIVLSRNSVRERYDSKV